MQMCMQLLWKAAAAVLVVLAMSAHGLVVCVARKE